MKCVCFFSRSSYKKEELSDNNLWIIRCLSEKKRNGCGECVSENHW